MKQLTTLFFLLLLVSVTLAAPGDILRNQAVTGQPFEGVRGLSMDWTTGNIWVAGTEVPYEIKYTTMNPDTMATSTWRTTTGVYWVFDIGYGYEDSGTSYLLMNDQNIPFTKMIDPADGSYDGDLPDYYPSGDYTNGCAVDQSTNNVYLSSFQNDEIVYYDGSSHTTFASISGGASVGIDIGWGHVFVLRSDPYYTIEVYLLDGTFVESIPLTGWNTNHYVVGLACGQENEVGNNETLFFASFVTGEVYEVEVGDYTAGSTIEESTWGQIKAGIGSPLSNGGSPAASLSN